MAEKVKNQQEISQKEDDALLKAARDAHLARMYERYKRYMARGPIDGVTVTGLTAMKRLIKASAERNS